MTTPFEPTDVHPAQPGPAQANVDLDQASVDFDRANANVQANATVNANTDPMVATRPINRPQGGTSMGAAIHEFGRRFAGWVLVAAVLGAVAGLIPETRVVDMEAVQNAMRVDAVMGPQEGNFETSAAGEGCMEHQPNVPSAEYTGEVPHTGLVLGMLSYYTANGNTPYCDGQAPSEADRAWAELYVQLGANPANVQSILGGAAATSGVTGTADTGDAAVNGAGTTAPGGHHDGHS